MREMTLEEMAMVTGGLETTVVTAPVQSSQSTISGALDALSNGNQSWYGVVGMEPHIGNDLNFDIPEIVVTATPNQAIAHKSGVDLSKLGSEISKALNLAKDVFSKYHIDMVVTSANDGNHMSGSKHYSNNAFDLRANNMTDAQERQLAAELQAKLGRNYFVGAEFFTNEANDHIHIEYDPQKIGPSTGKNR